MAKCATCGGSIINEGGDPVCLSCGRPGEVEVHQKAMTSERHKEIESHAAEIITDLGTMNQSAVMKKWKLSYTGLASFKRNHPEAIKAIMESNFTKSPKVKTNIDQSEFSNAIIDAIQKQKQAIKDLTLSINDLFIRLSQPSPLLSTLPPFPPFDPAWDPVTQQAWFASYIQLSKDKDQVKPNEHP